MKEAVSKARDLQAKRYKDDGIRVNDELSGSLLKKYIKISLEDEKILKMAYEKYNFSARSYNKILKLSRTIADLDGENNIKTSHILEALRYRALDDKYWRR